MTEDFSNCPLGKPTVYADQYDPNILFAINRDDNRTAIGIDVQDLLFQGVDIFNAFDFTWLNTKNLPEFGMLSIYIPCTSPNIIELKSLKLYLFSFANSTFQNINDIVLTIEQDLSKIAGEAVKVSLANILLDFMHIAPRLNGINIDNLNVACAETTITPELLTCNADAKVTEQLCSDLFKCNSIVTNKPCWGSIRISYTGPKIDQEGLLRYLISYRNQQSVQEQCIERIYYDVMQQCKPSALVVEGSFTRRGGIDINTIRAKGEFTQNNLRLFRQ